MAWQPDYATVAELRAYATRSSETVDDVELALAVTAASRAVDRSTNRQFGVVDVAEERTYPAAFDRRRGKWLVAIDDLMSTTGLLVGGVVFDPAVHRLEPLNAAQKSRPWTLLVLDDDPGEEVAITALWGWATVPDPVKQATLMQGNRFASRRTSPYGIAGSPDLGSELRLLARLDPDVAVTLGPFIRWWAAA